MDKKERDEKSGGYRCREKTAVVVCPCNTAVSASPSSQPAPRQANLILAHAAAVAGQDQDDKGW